VPEIERTIETIAAVELAWRLLSDFTTTVQRAAPWDRSTTQHWFRRPQPRTSAPGNRTRGGHLDGRDAVTVSSGSLDRVRSAPGLAGHGTPIA
jgi:hypothetical protein